MDTQLLAEILVPVPVPASGPGALAGYSMTCSGCGYVISYTIRSMVVRDMNGHRTNYCKSSEMGSPAAVTA